ncbi:MAG: M24 family metallopeptidase, partial [Romboutsia timonensis]
TRDMIKNAEQIEKIKESAKINTAVLDEVAKHIKPGMTTEEINTIVHNFTVEHGAIPAPLGYGGFPKSVCTSINDPICPGIPSEDDVLQDGDIVIVDVSTITDTIQMHQECSNREVSEEANRLVRVTKECMEMAIAKLNHGFQWV